MDHVLASRTLRLRHLKIQYNEENDVQDTNEE
jgi:hypothetical protein